MPFDTIISDRQRPLVALYKNEPSAAWVIDRARTSWRTDDPLHTAVSLGPEEPSQVPIALHRAVGGYSDEAVPGDLLCGALAACLDSTTRAVAGRLHIVLEELCVQARAEVDVRGTLLLDPNVPVAFQHMSAEVHLRCAEGTSTAKREMLHQLVEQCCIVARTLQAALPVSLKFVDELPEEPAGCQAKGGQA